MTWCLSSRTLPWSLISLSLQSLLLMSWMLKFLRYSWAISCFSHGLRFYLYLIISSSWWCIAEQALKYKFVSMPSLNCYRILTGNIWMCTLKIYMYVKLTEGKSIEFARKIRAWFVGNAFSIDFLWFTAFIHNKCSGFTYKKMQWSWGDSHQNKCSTWSNQTYCYLSFTICASKATNVVCHYQLMFHCFGSY